MEATSELSPLGAWWYPCAWGEDTTMQIKRRFSFSTIREFRKKSDDEQVDFWAKAFVLALFVYVMIRGLFLFGWL